MLLTKAQQAQLEADIQQIEQEVVQRNDMVNRAKNALDLARANLNGAEGYLKSRQDMLTRARQAEEEKKKPKAKGK